MNVRPARPDDYDDFGRLFRELESGDEIPPRHWWDHEAAPRSLMVEDAGRVVAYGFVDRYGEAAHVSHVVVSPEMRGKGVGRVLMNALAARLRAEGATQWQLNVKTDNTPAIRLYESLGLRTAWRTHALVTPWSVIAGLPATLPCRVRPLDPAEDAEFEARFNLPPGVLARRRAGARATHVFGVVPVEAERPVLGVATFTPSMPGSKPFQVAATEYGTPLVQALSALRDDDRPLHMGIDDEGFARRLIDAGAQVKFVANHMRGPIPA